ncbi:ADK-domain-containing protein [Dacryopinax primogenitus]|uniref:ADK-domain-containing protein n=1 Tax=Dacryopinax primogenitus (strain DJM 731) TaxID=1858805 RepID=M5GB18_DACPD|nr:ADK-domain-containing protein [Dacryopinax primogenitus]EJU05590.1 ADK-domain-containing protein [Dacryopinax primogenitus]
MDQVQQPHVQAETVGVPEAVSHPDSTDPAPAQGKPAFDHKKVLVIFVLGGPGAGKGTQSANLVKDYGFVHLSAGDLLRAEQSRPDSLYGALIQSHIREGTIVPMHVTLHLLEEAMRAALDAHAHPVGEAGGGAGGGGEEGKGWAGGRGWEEGRGRFLIDGFPRKMDQAVRFDKSVCKSGFVLFLSTTESVLLHRLTERSKTSGREDDNPLSISKRFRTFVETSMPVVEAYRRRGKVVELDASPEVGLVYEKIRIAVDAALAVVAP